jgi:D-aminopeptidase
MRTQTRSLALALCSVLGFAQNEARPRARDAGIKVGVLPAGPLNAITDVAGVKVGHTTLIQGDNIRTGVTAILPHSGNLFREKVPGAVFIGNAFGKLIGSTQVNELGEIETPILLTSTLSTPKVADALISYMLGLKGNENVGSVNPLVGETNDGYLSDIRSRPITEQDVFSAIRNARDGPVEEGCVGAGTGTVAFGFKGGIGTSSRRLPPALGGYTVGVLVQSNFGGVLTIAGAPVGRELGVYYLKDAVEDHRPRETADGSIMIVVATDAPLEHRNLNRLAARAMLGLGRTGSSGSNGSGDFVIAFSTGYQPGTHPGNEGMSPLFEAVIEATEEAIYNSLFRAHDTSGHGHTVKALPLKETLDVLRKHNAIALTQSDYVDRLQAIAQDIAALKPEFTQLSEFSVSKNTRTDELEIIYGYHTHNPRHRGGWTSGVPNPDDDGIWFFIDFHDAGSTAQIHTQPIYPALRLGDKLVEFLILQGANTKSVAGRITDILIAHGIQ